jgi:predicted ABC-type ATPase
MPKPKLRVFAGPNGSGKSTLFNAIKDKHFSTKIFVNTDLLEKQFKTNNFIDLQEFDIKASAKDFHLFCLNSGLFKKAKFDDSSWNLNLISNVIVKENKDIEDSYNSYHFAIIADFIRNELLKQRISFSFETVFSHPSKLEILKFAKAQGFKTYLYFIGTETPIINQERIKDRVKKGGHAVDEDKIISRYQNTMQLLFDMIKLVDESYIWDNSQTQQQFIALSKKHVIEFKETTIPIWVDKYLIEKLNNSQH